MIREQIAKRIKNVCLSAGGCASNCHIHCPNSECKYADDEANAILSLILKDIDNVELSDEKIEDEHENYYRSEYKGGWYKWLAKAQLESIKRLWE